MRSWGDGGQIVAFLMNNMLSFCDSDVALRCPEVEMAQIFQGLFDLFSGTTAYAPGNADFEGDDVSLLATLIATPMLQILRHSAGVSRALKGLPKVCHAYICNRFVLSEQADAVS